MRVRKQFITRSGTQLFCGATPFKIAGVNIGWLCQAPTNGWGDGEAAIIPSHFRIDDALQTASGMGFNMIRCHTLSPTLGSTNSLWVDGATYNEMAALCQDYCIAKMGALGLRTIIGLCMDLCLYTGQCNDDPPVNGAATYTTLNWSEEFGGNGTDFFTNPTVIASFKDVVATQINRVNRYNGLRYGDDPTIMAWETGNELQSAGDAWTTEIAQHIKSLAPRQLVVDGQTVGSFPTGSLSIPEIDLMGMHTFPMSVSGMASNKATIEGAGKVYYNGEFEPWGVTGGDDYIPDFSAALISGENNNAWYQFYGHDDGHGWPVDMNNYSAPYQFPLEYDEGLGRSDATRAAIVAKTREVALSLRSLPSDLPWMVPGVPTLALSGSQLAWQGAAGASSYTVEKSNSAGLGFFPYATGLLDEETPWGNSLPSGYYRVRAVNPDGIKSRPSNAVQIV